MSENKAYIKYHRYNHIFLLTKVISIKGACHRYNCVTIVNTFVTVTGTFLSRSNFEVDLM